MNRKRLLVTLSLLMAVCVFAGAQDGRRNSREKLDTIRSSIIVDDIRKPAVRTQTGMLKLIKDDFNFKSVMSSPDVLKTIQMLPGVAQGTEMRSEMYVRGGTGADNLYLLDNVPVYQTGHLLGLFSVFNTEMVGTVDFYKGGFPAKFGGRTSSVVDVGIKEGDLRKRTGMFSAGVTDGRFQIEGPIRKDVSSYNIAFRYGWVEAVLRPMVNKFNVDGTYLSNDITKDGHYGFGDIDAKVLWILGDSDKLTFNTFLSFDYMMLAKIGGKELLSFKEYDGNSFWGNGIISANWHHKFPGRTNLVATSYISDGVCDIYHRSETIVKPNVFTEKDDNVSNVLDFGTKVNAVTRVTGHNLRYGASMIFHRYGAFSNKVSKITTTGGIVLNNDAQKVQNGQNAFDLAVYAEDEASLATWLSVNMGLRYQMYKAKSKVYNFLEPRAAMSFHLSRSTSVKLAYSRMNQADHLIMSYLMDYPGNFWMPSTSRMKPMRADQYTVELDFRPDRVWYLNIGGFYKDMNNVSEYFGPKSRFPDQNFWETLFVQGKGRAYGAEIYAELRKGRFDLSGSYTLSWSERCQSVFSPDWYPDRLDNRHKINLNLIYKAHELINIYVNWAYHSGNKQTIPSFYYAVLKDDSVPNYVIDHRTVGISSPNNYSFPTYHRLDVGIDFKATNKRGRDYLVSFGCYNVYARKNPMTASVEESAYGGYGLRLTSVFTILPTIRYTMFF